MGWLRRWREARVLRQRYLADTVWQETVSSLPVLRGLSADENAQLRRLTTLFLHDKSLEPAQGLELTEPDAVRIAVQACLPILHLGMDWLRGWSAVIVYPYDFVGGHLATDDAGVVHEQGFLLGGESWQRGPVILSLPEVHNAGDCNGDNVIIHEIAHKLDMLNGSANGYPPLHRTMQTRQWSEAFLSAYEDLGNRVDSHIRHSIDAYATESPAECFAVFSEYFFTWPALLREQYPRVYEQLRQFYRQDPLERLR